MIVLTGTTGRLGSIVLRHLLKLLPPQEIIISLYNPDRVPDIPIGVQIRRADYADPTTLDSAFRGADSLFLVSFPSIEYEIRVQYHKAAIDAAKRSGIRRIWYTSLAFSDNSVCDVMKAHLETEKYIKSSGLTYTNVRVAIYTEYFPVYLGFFDKTNNSNDIYIPGDGKVAWAAREDLGEAMARLIASNTHENSTLLLSGPESNNLNLKQVAEIVSRSLRRNFRVHVVTVDEYVKRYLTVPLVNGDEDLIRKWATTYTAMERGEAANVDPLLETLLGRPALSVADILVNDADDTHPEYVSTWSRYTIGT